MFSIPTGISPEKLRQIEQELFELMQFFIKRPLPGEG